MLKSVNPATGELIATYESMSDATVKSVIDDVHERFHDWRKTGFGERSKHLRKAAELLRERQSHLATLMTREMGKLASEAGAEVEKCAWVCEYYAEHAEQFLQDEQVE